MNAKRSNTFLKRLVKFSVGAAPRLPKKNYQNRPYIVHPSRSGINILLYNLVYRRIHTNPTIQGQRMRI